jgi:hypothetical protein
MREGVESDAKGAFTPGIAAMNNSKANVAGTVSLKPAFKRLEIRSSRKPRRTSGCLPAGSATPQPCARA